MLIITPDAPEYKFILQRKEIESALDAAVERANICISKGWDDYLGKREANRSDFYVFVRENGYMIIAIWAYNKLSKVNKKKIEKGYEYQLTPEA